MSSQPDARSDAVLKEQVRLAFRHLPTMQLASAMVALVLAYVVRYYVSRSNVIAWVLMIQAIASARLIAFRGFRKVRDGDFPARLWSRIYLALALVSGSCWGLSAFIIFPTAHPSLMAMFVLIIASLATATTVSHASIKLAPAAWAGPAMLLYALRCFLEGGESGRTIALLIVLYSATILRYSLTNHATITGAIRMKFENLALLDELRGANEMLERDIAERKAAAAERERLVAELQQALAQVKTLNGLIPICAWCKQVRDDQGYWHAVEVYVREHSHAEFSHGVCPTCLERLTEEQMFDDAND